MNNIIRTLVPCATLLTALLAALSGQAQYNQVAAGHYAQNTNTPAANTNYVEVSATGSPNDVTTFSNAVAAAYATNYGGIFSFPANPSGTIFRATYGPANAKRLTYTTTSTMQGVGWPPNGTFNPVSYPNGTCQNGDNSGYSIAIGPITDAETDTLIISERVSQIGLVVLSRTSAQYPADVRITASYSDGSTEAVTSNIGNVRGTDDTFFGFTAPAGHAITNLQFESFNPGTETAKNTRIAFDDLGFITTPTGLLDPPKITAFNPPIYSVARASNGVQFEVRSAGPVDPGAITARLNTADISGQLVITGDPTNRLVSYTNLVANQRYTLEVTAYNANSTSSVVHAFYTAESPLVIFDAGGFSSDTLYPVGLLTAVTNDGSRWVPAADPNSAEIVDLADGQYGKVLRRQQLGADYIDYLLLPPVSSGVVQIELDARVSSNGEMERTLDLSLNSVTLNGGGTQGPFIMWGTNALNFYNGTAWVPQTNMDTAWHHVQLDCYVSGPLAGKFDLYVDNNLVGEKLVWRSTFSPVGTLRIGAIRGAVIQYGEVDNLVLRVAPEPLVAVPVTLTHPARDGANFSFSFLSREGINHVAQYTGDVNAGGWTSLVTNLGNGTILTVTHSNVPPGPLYYRVDSQLP